ncbi:hypothetical protein ACFJIV_02465 [Mucilaginibacter sp. UC70_90]
MKIKRPAEHLALPDNYAAGVILYKRGYLWDSLFGDCLKPEITEVFMNPPAAN